MVFLKFLITLLVLAHTTSAYADSIHGCGGFIEASSSLIRSRKSSNAKLDYSHITVELQTLDGLVKDSTQCAPNGYYFIPVYDKGSFIVKVWGPKGWTWEPEKVPVIIDHMGCNANEDINFLFTGFSLSGRVVGAVGGQSCRSKHGGPSNIVVELLSSADDLISSVLTSNKGEYSFKNPGYHLKAVGPHSFSCQKLGQISVHIYSKEVTEEPFPSALLSLSGDVGYRNNSITGAGGQFAFENLFPGSFYLRPLLKEYAFSPRAQPIELGSGESKEVVFEASRVAYSAMGVLTLLSGQPKEGVSIEARAESKGYYEETTTDSVGFFRLRGLLPDTTYIIKVSNKNDLPGAGIERASPEFLTIKVGSEDIKGLDFVVFEEPDRSILSCHVEGERNAELDSHLWVEVKSASEPSKVKSSFPLPLSRFFQVKDLPKGKHLLQLRSGLPLSTHKFISDVIEVDIEKHRNIHVGPLRYRIKEDVQIQNKGFSLRNVHTGIHFNRKERSKEASCTKEDILRTLSPCP